MSLIEHFNTVDEIAYTSVDDLATFLNVHGKGKFAGLAWSRNQSGGFDSDHTSMILSGNRHLRYYLVEAANMVRLHDPDYAAFYLIELSEAKTTPQKRALVLTARKLVHLVFALLQDNKLYMPPSP